MPDLCCRAAGAADAARAGGAAAPALGVREGAGESAIRIRGGLDAFERQHAAAPGETLGPVLSAVRVFQGKAGHEIVRGVGRRIPAQLGLPRPIIIEKLVFPTLGLDQRKNQRRFFPTPGGFKATRGRGVFAPQRHERGFVYGVQLARQPGEQFFHVTSGFPSPTYVCRCAGFVNAQVRLWP